MKKERKKSDLFLEMRFWDAKETFFLFGIPDESMSVPPEFAYEYTVYTQKRREGLTLLKQTSTQAHNIKQQRLIPDRFHLVTKSSDHKTRDDTSSSTARHFITTDD
jgi:hypothetical protein